MLANGFFSERHDERHDQNLESNLQRLLEEVVGRYIFGAFATSNGQIPMTTFYVTVAGFKNEGNVCELRMPQTVGPMCKLR